MTTELVSAELKIRLNSTLSCTKLYKYLYWVMKIYVKIVYCNTESKLKHSFLSKIYFLLLTVQKVTGLLLKRVFDYHYLIQLSLQESLDTHVKKTSKKSD